MQMSNFGGDVRFCLDRRNEVQFGLQPLQASRVDRLVVHARMVKIANLLFVGCTATVFRGQLCERLSENGLIPDTQWAGRAPRNFVRWDRDSHWTTCRRSTGKNRCMDRAFYPRRPD